MGLLVSSLQSVAPSAPAAGFSTLYPLSSTARWYFKTAAGDVKTLLTMEDSLGSITATNVTLEAGGALRTSTSAGNTALIQAYDTDTGPAYTTFGTLTAGTTPSFKLSNITMEGTWLASGTVTLPAFTLSGAITGGGNNATGLGLVSTNSAAIVGTAGAGYLDFTAQASNPASPSAGIARFHAATTQGFTRFEQDNEAPTNLVLGRDNVFIAKNTTLSTITAGQVVYVTGSTGNVPNIGLAKADSLTTLPAVGIALDSINANAFGQVMKLGVVSNTNTAAFTTGDMLWVDATTAGALTKVRPAYPNYAQRIGSCLVSGVGNGSLLITVAPFIGGQETGTTQDFTHGGNAVFATGKALQTSTSAGNTLLLQAYDTDTGPAYTTFGTLTAGITPSFKLSNITMEGTWLASGTVTLPAITVGGNLTLSGTAANLALGSNFISNGGTDAGLSFDASNNATLSGNLVISGLGPHAFGTTVDYALININTAFTSGGASTAAGILRFVPTLTGAAGDTSFQSTFIISPNGIITGGFTETIAVISTIRVTEPIITLGTGDSVTNAATLHIVNAPTEGASGNYALWVDAGTTRIDGTLELNGTAANIQLGANFISNGGTDAGLSLDASNNATLSAKLSITSDAGVAATKKFYFDGVALTGDTYVVESSANVLDLFAGGANTLRLSATAGTVTGNFGIGTATFGTNAVSVLAVFTGTAPTTGPADSVQFYSSDNSAGNTIPSFFCEGTEVLATGQADSASSVRVKWRINGTVVTLLAI